MTNARRTVCLSMIVKNEAPTIRRCLESVRPIIDHWVIVDTGSTDGTQALIKDIMHDLPGILHQRPWRDFAHNRSEALTLARRKADYSFIIDADDTIELRPDTPMPKLTQDSYTITIQDCELRYDRKQLVRNALPWRYEGVLHEFLTTEGGKTVGHLPFLMHRNHDGARRREPTTYLKDAAILEAAFAKEKPGYLKARYCFYLAQSYRDSNEPGKALDWYLRRAEMGFWQEEVFISLLTAARLMEKLDYSEDSVLAMYARAAAADPRRAEALHGASRYCRMKGRFKEGYELAQRGIGLTLPADALFAEPWIYETGLLDEAAVNGYWAGQHYESLLACLRVLASNSQLDDVERKRIAANATFALEKLHERAPTAPSRWRDWKRSNVAVTNEA